MNERVLVVARRSDPTTRLMRRALHGASYRVTCVPSVPAAKRMLALPYGGAPHCVVVDMRLYGARSFVEDHLSRLHPTLQVLAMPGTALTAEDAHDFAVRAQPQRGGGEPPQPQVVSRLTPAERATLAHLLALRRVWSGSLLLAEQCTLDARRLEFGRWLVRSGAVTDQVGA
jgi:hypothetical protein